ncbi:MAG: NUDIX domain-containing protein, partial [Actinobacteria bacterium]|nr:NUDIX domain-containing protein [Actinomycetota bacterium]
MRHEHSCGSRRPRARRRRGPAALGRGLQPNLAPPWIREHALARAGVEFPASSPDSPFSARSGPAQTRLAGAGGGRDGAGGGGRRPAPDPDGSSRRAGGGPAAGDPGGLVRPASGAPVEQRPQPAGFGPDRRRPLLRPGPALDRHGSTSPPAAPARVSLQSALPAAGGRLGPGPRRPGADRDLWAVPRAPDPDRDHRHVGAREHRPGRRRASRRGSGAGSRQDLPGRPQAGPVAASARGRRAGRSGPGQVHAPVPDQELRAGAAGGLLRRACGGRRRSSSRRESGGSHRSHGYADAVRRLRRARRGPGGERRRRLGPGELRRAHAASQGAAQQGQPGVHRRGGPGLRLFRAGPPLHRALHLRRHPVREAGPGPGRGCLAAKALIDSPVERPAARVLLVDPADRVLLIRFVDGETGYEWWATPGGGLLDQEGHEEAALREVFEETGLRDLSLGPCV